MLEVDQLGEREVTTAVEQVKRRSDSHNGSISLGIKESSHALQPH
jgi:hypothetical protein